jgi:hypothetical protein
VFACMTNHRSNRTTRFYELDVVDVDRAQLEERQG